MSHKTLSLLATAALALCASAPASAITYTFAASLNGANEPNNSTAFGTAVVVFDTSALTVAVTELWAGLTSNVTGNHIHCCTATPGSGTAPVYLGFTGVPTATTAFYSNTFTLPSASFTTLLTGTLAGQSYVNLHTTTFPGGEILGFLVNTAPVPEPATYAMLLGGLGAVSLMMRRRRQG